jgi:hypothetical protein
LVTPQHERLPVFRNRKRAWVLALLLATGIGVGVYLYVTREARITGDVTVKGTPLPAGVVYFHGGSPGPLLHATIDQGKYQLTAIQSGRDVTVTVDTTTIDHWANEVKAEIDRLETRRDLMEKVKQQDEELTKRIAEWKERLKVLRDAQKRVKGVKFNEKYTKKETSPLTFQIKGGEQTFNIKLDD